MIPYWSRGWNYYAISGHLVSVMVKFFLMTNMTHGEDKNDEGAFVLTHAMPIFLSHHHFLIFFSSREEGNSLAEAEAALSSWVMLRLWGLRTVWSGRTLNTFHKLSIKSNKTTDNILIMKMCRVYLVCLSPPSCFSLLPSGMFECLRVTWPLGATEVCNGARLFQVLRHHLQDAGHLIRHCYALSIQDLPFRFTNESHKRS